MIKSSAFVILGNKSVEMVIDDVNKKSTIRAAFYDKERNTIYESKFNQT